MTVAITGNRRAPSPDLGDLLIAQHDGRGGAARLQLRPEPDHALALICQDSVANHLASHRGGAPSASCSTRSETCLLVDSTRYPWLTTNPSCTAPLAYVPAATHLPTAGQATALITGPEGYSVLRTGRPGTGTGLPQRP